MLEPSGTPDGAALSEALEALNVANQEDKSAAYKALLQQLGMCIFVLFTWMQNIKFC
jgi:hypothetical protein